uniref:conserved oligomeric Golgi complex subunit 4-like n=1 Tax=Myxine glutinosa TaxID=7769 RepID=UPI00358E2815
MVVFESFKLLGIILFRTKDSEYEKSKGTFMELHKAITDLLDHLPEYLQQLQNPEVEWLALSDTACKLWAGWNQHLAGLYQLAICKIHQQHFTILRNRLEELVRMPASDLLRAFKTPLFLIQKRNDKLLDVSGFDDGDEGPQHQHNITEYQTLHSQLLDALPKFCAHASSLYIAILQGFVFAHTMFFGSCVKELGHLKENTDWKVVLVVTSATEGGRRISQNVMDGFGRNLLERFGGSVPPPSQSQGHDRVRGRGQSGGERVVVSGGERERRQEGKAANQHSDRDRASLTNVSSREEWGRFGRNGRMGKILPECELQGRNGRFGQNVSCSEEWGRFGQNVSCSEEWGRFGWNIARQAEKQFQISENMESGEKRAAVIFADNLTILFEGVARVVEAQQPVVETYYGPGQLPALLAQLQPEVDRQARRVLDGFAARRDVQRKFQLVQSSLLRGNAGDKMEPRKLDSLLAELTLMNARSELYLRFLRRRVTADLEACEPDVRTVEQAQLEKLLSGCGLSCAMQELMGEYVTMEEYFMKENVNKAVTMESVEKGQHTSSMVDDVFFIIKKCVGRALASSSVDCLCAMINHATTLLDTHFRELLVGRLQQGFPAGALQDLQRGVSSAVSLVQSGAASLVQPGRFDPRPVDSSQEAQRVFLVTLNNAELCCEYIYTLNSSLECQASVGAGRGEQARAKIQSCVADLVAVSEKFQRLLQEGISDLNNSSIKPQVKPWISSFLSVSHNIEEEEFNDYEANDP